MATSYDQTMLSVSPEEVPSRVYPKSLFERKCPVEPDHSEHPLLVVPAVQERNMAEILAADATCVSISTT